jgi:hypothetical protein
LDLVGKNGEISEKTGKKTRDEFMRKTNTGLTAAACLAVSAFMGVNASAQNIIYDNSSGPLGQRTGEGNTEIGDQVIFAGTARTVQQVSFEYFVGGGTPGLSGNETATFFMYRIDSATKLPSTLLYTSPTFNLVPATSGGFGTATISGISVDVPDQIAWTVSFAGLENSESAGLLFYNPPSVGSSPTFVDPNDGSVHDFFLRHNVSGWQVLDTPNLVDNLNVRFTAVPEPSTVALILGGLVTMGVIRRRK